MVSLRFFIVNIFVHLDLESPSLYRLFTKGLPARFSRVFWNMNINILSKLPNSFVRLFLKIWLWWSEVFVIEGCDNVTMCDNVNMIKGVYYQRLWQCQGCSDKGRSYSLKQPAGPKVMMRSKKRNMIMMKYDYHPLIIVTSTPLEHENDEKYKVKVHSRQRSLLSHSVNFIRTLVLLNEYAVCLFTLD